MKKNILLLWILSISMYSQAQKPEPILSFATVLKPAAYYKEQSILWEKEILKDSLNAFAWYNYYRANRNFSRTDPSDKRSREQKDADLRKIVDRMGKAVPNSFDYNLCKWMAEGNNFEYLSYLKKAEELGSDRTEHLSDLVVWAEVERNIEKRNAYSKLMYQKGPVSPGLLYYNYNVLAGLKPNSILITCGDNDSYPAWIQQSLGFRQDVLLLNIYLLKIKEYREKIFKELGLPMPKELKVDSLSEKWFANNLISFLAGNPKNRPVSVAVTCGNQMIQPYESNLYLTGLAYEYSTSNINNIAIIQKNMELLYALDYIENSFFQDISEYYTYSTHFNYVVPMIKLYNHYVLAGDVQGANKIKAKLVFIAKGRPEEQEILNMLNP